MNIRQRILLLVVTAFAALAGVGGFAVYQASSSARDVRLVTDGVVPSAQMATALMGQLKDVQITALAMVAATDNETVQQLREQLKRRQAELQGSFAEQLKLADSDAQRGLVTIAQEGLANYFSSVDEVAKYKLEGQKELAEAMLAANVDPYLREQGELTTALQVEKTRSKDAAVSALNAKLGDTRVTLAGASLVAVLGLAIIGWLLYRQIVRPIGAMEQRMTAIASSQDYSQRMDVGRQDEIGRSMRAFNAMIERIEQSTALVRQKTADMHAMLHGIPQGIMTLQSGGVVHPEYSSHLAVVLGHEQIAGRNVAELLFETSTLSADARSQIAAAIDATIGEDEMNFGFNSHLLPLEIERNGVDGQPQILDLNWAPMCDANGLTTRLLLCVRDVTELRALARAAASQARELALIGEILAVPQEKFEAFCDDAIDLVAQCTTALDTANGGSPDTIGRLFRLMHTVKGNARTHGLLQVANVAHQAEDRYAAIRDGRSAWDQDELKRDLDELRALLHEVQRLSVDKLGRRGPGRRGRVDRYTMVPNEQVQRLLATLSRARLNPAALDDAARDVALLGTERFDELLGPVQEGLAGLAAELGKATPVLALEDGGVVLRSQIVAPLRNAFMHLVRNALDHGIEPPADRQAAGKPLAAHIAVRAALGTSALRVEIQDDGRGLALARIRAKAIETGLLAPEAEADDDALAALVFDSGFSTATAVTQVSGRGVGMDAVRAIMRAENGDVHIEWTGAAARDSGHRPFKWVLSLPARLAAHSGSAAVAETTHA
jgi:two-component system, chemotaxis family, sensor kinase CheA